MAKLILVLDVDQKDESEVGHVAGIADEIANCGNAEVRVRSVSGRRIKAALGESKHAPHPYTFSGPSEMQIEAAFVADDSDAKSGMRTYYGPITDHIPGKRLF